MTDDVHSFGPSALSGLREVVHVHYSAVSDWLVAVQFRFEEGYLCIEADPADDTIEVTFDQRRATPLRFWESDLIRVNANEQYARLLGRTSTWQWVLRNQQGFQDAFQIELGTQPSCTTLQYLVVASRLQLRRVDVARIP